MKNKYKMRTWNYRKSEETNLEHYKTIVEMSNIQTSIHVLKGTHNHASRQKGYLATYWTS